MLRHSNVAGQLDLLISWTSMHLAWSSVRPWSELCLQEHLPPNLPVLISSFASSVHGSPVHISRLPAASGVNTSVIPLMLGKKTKDLAEAPSLQSSQCCLKQGTCAAPVTNTASYPITFRACSAGYYETLAGLGFEPKQEW